MYTDQYHFKVPRGLLAVLASGDTSPLDFGEKVNYRPDKAYGSDHARAQAELSYNNISAISFHRAGVEGGYQLLPTKLYQELHV